MRKNLLLSILLFCFISHCSAFEAFIIEDIEIQGNKLIGDGVVLNKLNINIGDKLDNDETSEVIKSLVSTKFFDSVSLYKDGNKLIIEVKERPSIEHIKINGGHNLQLKLIQEQLDAFNIKAGRIYDPSIVEDLINYLEQYYYSIGYYGAKVVLDSEFTDNDTVIININITEGKISKIKRISIIGANDVDERVLRKQIYSKKENIFGWYSKNDQYSKQRFAADLEVIRDYYLDRGYLDFSIDSYQTSITKNKRDVYLSVNITEGSQYTVDSIRFIGDDVLSEDELIKLFLLNVGDIYSEKKLKHSIDSINSKLGDFGYLFPQVNAARKINKETNTISFTVYVQPNNKYYVRKINFSGNETTREYVLRRYMQQFEGGLASSRKVKDSKYKLNSSGFFKRVDVETPIVPGSSNLVDVDCTVTEGDLSSLIFGGSWAGREGWLGNITLKNKNFIGTGNDVDLDLEVSAVKKRLLFSFSDPYYTDEGVSRGYGIRFESYDTDGYTKSVKKSFNSYKNLIVGGHLHFSIPLSLKSSFGVRADTNYNQLSTTDKTDFETIKFIKNHTNDGSYIEVLTTSTWLFSDLDNVIFPRAGFLNKVSLELATPLSTVEYFTINESFKILGKIDDDHSWYFKTNILYGRGYGKFKDLPFYKSFLMGGPLNVRGYSDFSLGPDTATGSSGGDLLVRGSAGIIFNKLFGFSPDNARFIAFADFGQLYDVIESNKHFSFKEMKASIGFGVDWLVPGIGPITTGLALPLNATDDDSTSRFFFSAGFSI